MITPERTGLLKSFLGGLPEQIAARLAQAVEVDRLVDGKSLPHEMILEGLRPALRRARTACYGLPGQPQVMRQSWACGLI